MYYSAHYRTKWHDTDGDGFLRPSALLVYMQETANLQCREYGMDLTDLHHVEGKGFLLSRMTVKVFAQFGLDAADYVREETAREEIPAKKSLFGRKKK